MGFASSCIGFLRLRKGFSHSRLFYGTRGNICARDGLVKKGGKKSSSLKPPFLPSYFFFILQRARVAVGSVEEGASNHGLYLSYMT